jgi:Fatty acid desaturase
LDYRLIHFAHHRHLGEEGDPDLHNYRPFPATRREVVIKILRECSGVGAALQLLGSGKTTSGACSHLFRILVAQLCIFGLFMVAGHPFGYLWLWLLPLGTFAKGFAQLRNLAEHFIRSEAPHGTERLRTFHASCLERFFLAPFNFQYHAEHHWYTNVPYYHLPALRKLLQSRPGFVEYAELSPSYISVLRRLVRPPSSL